MLKQVVFTISFAMLLLFSASCSSGNQEKEFSNAKIFPHVNCIADTNLNYALFLPPQYKKGQPLPLLILFDSHGNGLLPVNLFSDEAAKHGFIIAGSNNSKNGMSMEQTTAIYRSMLADLTARFSIGKKAVYLCGFSGGSRVAGSVAITEGGVAGVVGCGAGLPGINQQPASPFSYLAVVGNQDFNFTEMKMLDESLDKAGFTHHLLVFDGIHQWPPKQLIPDIFAWLKLDAMRQQAIPADRVYINQFIEKNDQAANKFATEGKLPEQLDIYIKMKHYLQGLTDTAPLDSEINRLSAEKSVLAYREQQQQLFSLEQKLQQEYLPQIPVQSTNWWANETNKLNALAKQTDKPGLSQVYQRVLGSLSMSSYMYCNNALKQRDLDASARFIEIYSLVDPSNAEHRFMAAKLAAMRNEKTGVLNALQQAFAMGFKDTGRIKSDPDFLPYRQDESFKKLIPEN